MANIKKEDLFMESMLKKLREIRKVSISIERRLSKIERERLQEKQGRIAFKKSSFGKKG